MFDMMRMMPMLMALFDREALAHLRYMVGVIVLMSLSQMAGFALVLPFLQLLAEPDGMEQSRAIEIATALLGPMGQHQLVMLFGVLVIALLIVSAGFSIFALLQQHRLTARILHSLSMDVSECYQDVPYDFHLRTNSSELIRRSIDDINGVVAGVLVAGSQFLSSAILSAMILLLLFVVNFWITLLLVTVLTTVFGVLLLSRKKILSRMGRQRIAAASTRYQAFVELLRGVKAVKAFGARNHFLKRLEISSLRFNQLDTQIKFMAGAPRFIIEALLFGSAVLVTLIASGAGADMARFTPSILLFALAGSKLIPAFSLAYTSLSTIVSNLHSVERLHRDLEKGRAQSRISAAPVSFSQRLTLEALTFSYDVQDDPVIRNVSLEVRRGDKVALIGPSGSGKSTVIDLIAGMLQPTGGRIMIDDTPLDPATVASWRSKLGYVPQDVFLTDDTIAANIAFGVETPDMGRIRWACDIVQLTDFIAGLRPGGIETLVGESGVRLSGGQKQRIGIARALYRKPDVLLLDEATSALDEMTEARLVKAVHSELGDMTIIMIAHRMSTVRACDRIYLMDRGEIIDSGSYDTMFKGRDLSPISHSRQGRASVDRL